MIKKYFLTGLVLFLPPAITLLILIFLLEFFLYPFVGIATAILAQYEIFTQPYPFLTGDETLALASRIFVLIILILVMLLVGYLGRLFLLRFFGNIFEYFISQIPVFNKIYKSLQQVVKNLYAQRESKFSRVVLVPFPHSKILSLGFITQERLPTGSATEQDQIAVFVSCVPNPIFGFSLLFRKEEVIPLNITFGEAAKLILSCGIIQPKYLKHVRSNK
jgi:uncharacterized membrane protein